MVINLSYDSNLLKQANKLSNQFAKTQPLHNQEHSHAMRGRFQIEKPCPHHGPSSTQNWQILRASHTWTKDNLIETI